jgi:plasmid stabilization system protein ParE
LKITFNPEAAHEFGEAAAWYADEAGTAQARDFRDEIQRALLLLFEQPAMGLPGTRNTRSFVVHRYPYSIVYRVQSDTLRILAIASHSRRPGYWAGRR